MNCREARHYLSPYLDSELEPTTTFAISEHLRWCNDCRQRFDAERQVDRQIVARLDVGDVPHDVWRDALRPLRTPRWTRWPFYVPLAAAAVIVLMMGIASLSNSTATHARWVVREFVAETNNGRPFASNNTDTVSAGTTTTLKPFTNLVARFTPQVVSNHALQLVRLSTVRDADGSEMVEVRLNCCGEPVIVRAAKRDRPGRLREFIGQDATMLASRTSGGDVRVTEREVGEYIVVAVSQHPADELLAAMTVQ